MTDVKENVKQNTGNVVATHHDTRNIARSLPSGGTATSPPTRSSRWGTPLPRMPGAIMILIYNATVPHYTVGTIKVQKFQFNNFVCLS